MSETKFTPGPWTSEYDGHGGIYIGCDKHQIGFVSNRGPQEANAALIVTAPELYSMVEWLINRLEEVEHGHDAAMTVKDARALLKKARGEA